MITQSELKELLHYNPETGIFTRKTHLNKHCKINDIAGHKTKHGYVTISIKSKTYYAHRLAWLYVYGEMPKNVIDHINGNGMDNKIINLRDVTQSINIQNILKIPSHNKSGLMGVSFYKKTEKWRASLTLNKKHFHLGLFKTPELAHEAYLKAKRELYEGCTV